MNTILKTKLPLTVDNVTHSIAAIKKSYPTGLMGYYVSSVGAGKLSLRGPHPTWSFVDGADPTINDGFLSLCPAYTNELPSGAEDFSTWDMINGAVFDSQLGTITLPAGASARLYPGFLFSQEDYTYSVVFSEKVDDVVLRIFDGTGIFDEPIVEGTCSLSAYLSSGGGYVYIRNTGSNTVTVTPSNPQIVNSPYLFPYIPPGTSKVSQASTSGGNGVGFELDTELKGIFEGVPDGVELWENPDTNPYMTDNGDGTFTSLDTGIGDVKEVDAVEVGDYVEFSFNVAGYTSGSVGISTSFTSGGGYVTDDGDHTYTCIALTTDPRLVSTVAGVTFSNISVQKLNPAQGTVATLVRMGVGSGEVPDDTSRYNLLSLRDETDDLLLWRSVGTDKYPVRSSDDSNTANIFSGTWSRNEKHLKIVQYNGTQFRVGNKRYTADMVAIDADVVWSSWVTFDGSFDPLDWLRLGYLNTVPLHLGSLCVWDNGDVLDADIEKWGLKYV